MTERAHCPRLPSILRHNRPFGGVVSPWQARQTPGQSKQDSSLKYTTDLKGGRRRWWDTDTKKDTSPRSGSGREMRDPTPGLSSRLFYWRLDGDSAGFGRPHITLHYPYIGRALCHPSMKSLPLTFSPALCPAFEDLHWRCSSHSWKNAKTLQTRLCCFPPLLC